MDEFKGLSKETLEAIQACIDHARDLLDSAKAVETAGKPNIAYHLATLALEEIGRRELLAIKGVAEATASVPPAWPTKHTQDHIQKLFWAFFGAGFLSQKITKDTIEEMRSLARRIHATRIAGLYVESDEDGLRIPSAIISMEECDNLIAIAEARLEIAAGHAPRSDVPQEDIDLQQWFLETSSDDTKRKYVFSEASMAKLAEFADAREWMAWLKKQFEAIERQGFEIAQRELQRSSTSPGSEKVKKWKLRFRLFSDSHSIRPKALTSWNDRVDWLNLLPVQDKREMIVELLFDSGVSPDRLWVVGWTIARMFVTALNLGTQGFFWWRLPEQTSRYYERIDDLENKCEIALDRNPQLKIGWGKNLVLDDEAIRRTMICIGVVMNLSSENRRPILDYYIGGLTFLSLNDVHWQCEVQAYGNFHESLKAMMKEFGGWREGAPFEATFGKYIAQWAPAMPKELVERYVEIAQTYESGAPPQSGVDLSDVGFLKVLCDRYFLSVVVPAVMPPGEVVVEIEGSDTDGTNVSNAKAQ